VVERGRGGPVLCCCGKQQILDSVLSNHMYITRSKTMNSGERRSKKSGIK
jgi:hypothetical protein